MIKFINLRNEIPYQLFREKYSYAYDKGQKNIEAICVSSYDIANKEINSRFVNLKYVNCNKFIFFTNYNSPKSEQFESHDKIAVLIYWPLINTQIRMKGKIKKTSKGFNDQYFAKRSYDKNALAISSRQSQKIDSYESVLLNYKKSLKNDDLGKCPEYWGGYAFKPYYFEFWQGDTKRLNKRKVYEKRNNQWVEYFVQP